jgi:hypothetical protein
MKLTNMQLVLLSLLFAAAAGSCKKNDPNEGLDSPRLFKPGSISVKKTDTTATISWGAPLLSEGQKLNYTVECAKDSNFVQVDFALQSDSTSVLVNADKAALRTKYYIRVKANAYKQQPESKWVTGASFSIDGEQLFLPIRDVELTESRVTLRWKKTAGLTKILLQLKNSAPVEYPLSADNVTNGFLPFTGLRADTSYTAELMMGAKSKGILTFKTLQAVVFTRILNPGDDIVAAVTAAANNDIIGLNAGTYSAGASAFTLSQKSVTLQSVSNNPADTRVNFKEFTLRGTGAGIRLKGIELDGTASASLYFINLTGVAADAEKAAFADVVLDNCIVHGAATSFLRANRGAAAGDYTMNQILVKNSIVYDVATGLSYNCFHLDKLQLGSLQVSKSTFYNIGQALASSSTVLTQQSVFSFDYCTFNNFGAQNKYVLMDANANPVTFNITNSIIANIPRPAGSVQGVAIRASGAGTSITFSNNNTFNLTNGTTTALTMPTANITQVGNNTIQLGWTATTTDFTLPLNSVLRTVSNTGTAIGDPRWTY